MSEIKLTDGKWYRLKEGSVVKMEAKDENSNPDFPFVIVDGDKSFLGMSYTENGLYVKDNITSALYNVAEEMTFEETEKLFQKKEERPVICCMVPPVQGKGWTFQMFTDDTCVRDRVYAAFKSPFVRETSPFLQSDSNGFVMVEFWTRDETSIRTAVAYLAGICQVHEIKEGLWTREELEATGWL